MKISRSAGDGPLTIIYSSVRQAQPDDDAGDDDETGYPVPDTLALSALEFFLAARFGLGSLVVGLVYVYLSFISVSLILFFTVTPSQFYLINAHIHWRAWTQ